MMHFPAPPCPGKPVSAFQSLLLFHLLVFNRYSLRKGPQKSLTLSVIPRVPHQAAPQSWDVSRNLNCTISRVFLGKLCCLTNLSSSSLSVMSVCTPRASCRYHTRQQETCPGPWYICVSMCDPGRKSLQEVSCLPCKSPNLRGKTRNRLLFP